MSELLKRIDTLINTLPEKDIPIGHKFLKSMDFDSLKELVDSAIIKIQRSKYSENPKYLNIDLVELNKLKAEVDIYKSYLEINIDQDDEDDEVNYIELDEDELY